MNYSRHGVAVKQKSMSNIGSKLGHKLILSLLKLFFIALVGIGIIGISAGIGMFKGILASTPQITSNDVAPVGAATFVYDSAGNKIDELVASNSNRIPVTMDKIPQHLAYAIVALEDVRFYENNGIDIKGIGRSAFVFLTSMGKRKEGASTITQQLLKNTIFTEWTEEGNNLIKQVKRKLQEQYLAIELTKILDKNEILERYLNTINLGQNTLGVEAAAQRYFGKSVSELTLSESAVIASITKNPSAYNPISHPEDNAERREKCLSDMRDAGFITQDEYEEAMADDVYARIENHNISYLAESSTSSYFVDALTYDVKEDLIARNGLNETQAEFLLTSGGLRIYTTMDPDIQKIVDEQVANPDNFPENVKWLLDYRLTITHKDGTQQNYSNEMMQKYFKETYDKSFNRIFASQEEARQAAETYRTDMMQEGDKYDERISILPQPQVSVVIMEDHTGYVRAMSGGRGVKEGRLTLNRATSSKRQPGSTFKVLAAYAPALDSAGLTLASVFNDAPFNYDTGEPVDNWYTTGYKGIVTVRYAIEQSMNIIAVKTLTQITPQLGFDYLKNLGFTTLTDGKSNSSGQVFSDVRQPLALGGITDGVTNEELTAAFATIANGGVYNKPKLYTKVLDSDGRVILDNTVSDSRQVLKETTAFLLTDAMVDVVTKGTGSKVNFGKMAIAGKTGTTTSNVDVWFAGFTPYYTCAVWAGYDNNVKMVSKTGNDETGIAKTLWRAIMAPIHENLENIGFTVPDGIVRAQVCSKSGKLPVPGLCDVKGTVRSEYFAADTVPTESCDIHYEGLICAYDLLKASDSCPFPIMGVAELPLVEDVSLQSGSSVPVTQPDGSVIYEAPNTTATCQHTPEFFLQPDCLIKLEQQRLEMIAAGLYTPETLPSFIGYIDPVTGAVMPPGTGTPGTVNPSTDPGAGGTDAPAADPSADQATPAAP